MLFENTVDHDHCGPVLRFNMFQHVSTHSQILGQRLDPRNCEHPSTNARFLPNSKTPNMATAGKSPITWRF